MLDLLLLRAASIHLSELKRLLVRRPPIPSVAAFHSELHRNEQGHPHHQVKRAVPSEAARSLGSLHMIASSLEP